MRETRDVNNWKEELCIMQALQSYRVNSEIPLYIAMIRFQFYQFCQRNHLNTLYKRLRSLGVIHQGSPFIDLLPPPTVALFFRHTPLSIEPS